MATKYGRNLTCNGHLDVKPSSRMPTFSSTENLVCYNRNSAARNSDLKRAATWFGVSSFAQRVAVDSLNLQFCEELRKSTNSAVTSGKGKQGRVRWNSITSSYGGRSSFDHGSEGNPQTQEILVEMVKVEVAKVRLTDFLDKSSQNIRNISQQTQLEYDQLADLTVKRLDASGSRVLRELDANANAFRKELNLANADIEAQSRHFEELQLLATYSRNDGLFFKNLYKAPQVLAYRSTLSRDLLQEKNVPVASSVSTKDLTRSYKQILYGGLSLVFVSFMWSSGSALLSGTYMRASKLMSYGVIISLLLTQLAYAKVLTGEADVTEKIEDESE
eukprot:Gb_22930 [translate_table: standard]